MENQNGGSLEIREKNKSRIAGASAAASCAPVIGLLKARDSSCAHSGCFQEGGELREGRFFREMVHEKTRPDFHRTFLDLEQNHPMISHRLKVLSKTSE